MGRNVWQSKSTLKYEVEKPFYRPARTPTPTRTVDLERIIWQNKWSKKSLLSQNKSSQPKWDW